MKIPEKELNKLVNDFTKKLDKLGAKYNSEIRIFTGIKDDTKVWKTATGTQNN